IDAQLLQCATGAGFGEEQTIANRLSLRTASHRRVTKFGPHRPAARGGPCPILCRTVDNYHVVHTGTGARWQPNICRGEDAHSRPDCEHRSAKPEAAQDREDVVDLDGVSF